jgi:hypothetical protein
VTAIPLRRLTSRGIAAFSEILDTTATTGTVPAARVDELIADPNLTEVVGSDAQIVPAAHKSRRSLGIAVHDALADLDLDTIEADNGLFAWLALVHLNHLVYRRADGSAVPGARARWIRDHRFTRYYRHIIWGPWAVVRAHRGDLDAANVVLCTPPARPGDLVEQLTSRMHLLTNPAVLGVATRMYVNPDTGTHRPGAAAKDTARPGTNRRYIEVLNTLELTWHLSSLEADDLANLLPPEFELWLNRAA